MQQQAQQLLSSYNHFTAAQRASTQNWFEQLAAAYPHKCYHTAGYTDLWLTAIAAERDGGTPWL